MAKMYQYLVKENNGTFYQTVTYYKYESDFLEEHKNKNFSSFWKIHSSEMDSANLDFDLNESDIEEIKSKDPIPNRVLINKALDVVNIKLGHQYEWRYQKSMLWFITPTRFESADKFKEHMSKTVILDLIDWRQLNDQNNRSL